MTPEEPAVRWDDDDALLAALGEALRSAGPPTDAAVAAAAGRAAWAWRTVDAELAVAELVLDSAVDDDPALQREAGDDTRTLVFSRGGTSLEVSVRPGPDGPSLVGQLVPPGPGEVEALGPAGVLASARADDVGCFTLAPGAPGPVRLRVAAGGAGLVTEWLVL